jgi:hypothetical protein
MGIRATRRGAPAEQEDAVEKLRVVPVMEVELRAETEALGEVRPGRRAGHHDEAVGVGEGQRLEQDRVDDAEHPDDRSDGETEGGNGGDEKARGADERPPGVTKVREPLRDHTGPLRETGVLDGVAAQ